MLETLLACIGVLVLAVVSLIVCMGVLPAAGEDPTERAPQAQPYTYGGALVWLGGIVLLAGAYAWWLALGALFFPPHGPR